MRHFALIAGMALLGIGCLSQSSHAQPRVQIPSPYRTAPPLVPVNPMYGAPGFSQRGASLGGAIQPFDPYALPDNIVGAPGSAFPGVSPYGPQSGWPGGPRGMLEAPPPGARALPPLPGTPYGQPTNPSSSPWDTGPSSGPNYSSPPGYGTDPNAARPPYQRLFQDTGLRGTYIYGKDKDDLAMTEAEASTTAYFANFLGVPNGLRVTPGFVFHWTDGPKAPETADVPARLYSGYIDFGMNPHFTERFSAELTARVGIYSDFQAFNADSIRLLGSAVGVYQLNQFTSLKFGAAYIDRVRVKLLPAVGFLWEPNPETRWDVFFPAPKLANYWTTIGNRQVWWYLGGEYGGGSWSIERADAPSKGLDERIDINDIRVYLGIESWETNRFYSFAEVGYVFDRKIVYFREPGDSLNIDDSFMVRAGLSW